MVSMTHQIIMWTRTKILLQFLATFVAVSATSLRCKCVSITTRTKVLDLLFMLPANTAQTPYDPCWPSPANWSNLNVTISGALIQTTPPASVCYPSQPNYNEEACTIVRSRWFDSTFHGADPVSIDYPVWTNNSCNPIYPNGTSVSGDAGAGARGCDADTYPAYVVNATKAKQIATALQWAAENNIRVIVKGTGHSYTGRSTAPHSLSIWTHNLRGISYESSFQPTSCSVSESTEAVRVAAGHTNGEIQAFLAPYGKVIVSGTNPSVGIIGWVTGGGHGWLSSTYGIGSDNLLQATIVLPSGETIIANPCQNADVFFAIRGGGGGTFGIVTEVVLQTHPTPRTTQHTFALSSLSNTTDSQFWDAIGFLHAQMQRLKAGGMQGYYYMVGPPAYPSLSFLWSFMLFDKPNGTAEALTNPLSAYLTEHANLFVSLSNVTHYDTYFALAQTFDNEPVATGSSTYGSRLMSPLSLSSQARNKEILQSIGPTGNASRPNGPTWNPTIIGHMVGAPNTPSYYSRTSSLNPAWRDTLVHLVVVEGWIDGSPQDVADAVRRDVTDKTQKLRKASPETGAYFNEADSNEVDWQESFFGENYERLRQIKEDVDPGNLLWCRKCVGSEAFVEREGGRLCRVGDGRDENGDWKEKDELRP